MYKKAFTLAEVLIVMAIIGTVSAFTIPNLLSNNQEDQKVVKLRKIYSEIDLAYQEILLEHDGNIGTWTSNRKVIGTALSKRLKGISTGTYQTSNTYFPSVPSAGAIQMELNDGSAIAIVAECGGSSSTAYLCVQVSPDGKSGGQVHGKDIFAFFVYPFNGTGVIPAGFGADRNSSTDAYNISSGNYYSTNWVISNGNLDYLKCSGLNWKSKTSCN